MLSSNCNICEIKKGVRPHCNLNFLYRNGSVSSLVCLGLTLKRCAGVGVKGCRRSYYRKNQEFEAAGRLTETLKLSALDVCTCVFATNLNEHIKTVTTKELTAIHHKEQRTLYRTC